MSAIGDDRFFVRRDALNYIADFVAGVDSMALFDVGFGELSFSDGASSGVGASGTSGFIAVDGITVVEVFGTTAAELSNTANFTQQ